MPVPSPRNSIRIARGNIADLTANAAAFGEGEILYAIDEDRFYTSTGGSLEPVGSGFLQTKSIDALADVNTSTVAPGVGQVLKWDGTNWVPADDTNTDAVTSVNGQTGDVVLDADDISDAATTNKFTTAADISKLAGIEPGATADQTATEIKTAYESNLDTNAFTDAEQFKLAGIEAGAQVNTVDSVAGKAGAVTLVKGDVGLGNVDNTSDLNKPISTATQNALDLKADLVGGVIPNSQLPSLAITEYLGAVASEAAMLALTGQRGDWAIRTDTGSTWIITNDGGSLIGDWTELATPADAVTSVNGYQGAVVLSAADVGAATAAQGALADSAVQPADNVSVLTNDAGYVDAAGASAAAPVQSVAGKAGAVTLVKADITDFADGDYATAAQGTLADNALQPGDRINAAAGTAAEPGIYFDANTGLYSPGADQLALSTNSTGRLFVDANGNVKVANGTLLLGPSGAEGGQLEILNPTDTGTVYILDASTASNARLFTTSNNTDLQIGQLTGTGGNVSFYTGTSERLRITSAGLVGIGTSSPNERFTVANGDMQLQGNTYTDFSDFWGSGDNSAFFLPYGYLGSNGAFNVSLYANGYRNNTSGFTYMGIDGNTNTAAGIDLDPDGEIYLRTGTASGTSLPARLFIDSTGNVGIGTRALPISSTAKKLVRY